MAALDIPAQLQHPPLLTAEHSLVLPSYNEFKREDVFKTAIDGYQNFLSDRIPGFELVVFADGCEKSALIAESMGAVVMRHSDGINHGRGQSLREAMLRLSDSKPEGVSKVYAYTDADGSYAPEHILDLMEAIDGGYDLAVSHRLDNSDSSLARRIAHVGMHELCEIIAPTGIKDPQAGAKGFSQKFVDEVFPQTVTERWAFDRELAALARRDSYRVVDLGTDITVHDESTVNPIKDAIAMVRDSRIIRKTHLS